MPSMMEYRVDQVIINDTRPITVQGNHALLGDWSRTGLEKVDARFVGSHARFCKSFQLVALAKKSAPELVCNLTKPIEKLARTQLSPLWQRRSVTSILSKFFTTPMRIIWSIVPTSLRIATYEILRKIGRRWYGIDDPNTKVQRIPFGLYLKYHGDSAAYRNEYNALKNIEQYTSISAPRALDIATKFIQDADEEDPFDFGPVTANYLLITRVPGTTLASTYNAISDKNMQEICLQLQQYISQIRDIPRTNKSDTGICNTLGEAIRDPRVSGGDAVGPFPDETAFNQNLRFPDDASRSGHKVVFTHADLNPRNVMVQRVRSKDGDDRWQVSGIVDWEATGYYPEYWDCTKSLFERFRWPKRYNDMIKRVFGVFGDYSREMDVEIRSWEAGDGI